MVRHARFIVMFAAVTVLAGIGAYASGELHTVKFETLAVDAGPVREGQPVRARFVFRNDGRRKVEIIDVVPACGGAEAHLVRGRTLARGQDGEVEVVINTAGHQGPVAHEVAVTLKDPLERTVILTIKTFVDREFVPKKPLIEFGKIVPGVPAQGELAIQLNRTEYDVANARSTDENFDAYVDSNRTDGTARIIVTVRPQTQPGLKFGTIRIGTTSPHMPQLTVPVRAVVAGSLQ
jgi:hypothetical protein